MTPAEMSLHVIIIRSMRTIANAWERWVEEQKLEDRVPPRESVADQTSTAPVMQSRNNATNASPEIKRGRA